MSYLSSPPIGKWIRIRAESDVTPGVYSSRRCGSAPPLSAPEPAGLSFVLYHQRDPSKKKQPVVHSRKSLLFILYVLPCCKKSFNPFGWSRPANIMSNLTSTSLVTHVCCMRQMSEPLSPLLNTNIVCFVGGHWFSAGWDRSWEVRLFWWTRDVMSEGTVLFCPPLAAQSIMCSHKGSMFGSYASL